MNTSDIANPSHIQVSVLDQVENNNYPSLSNTNPTKTKHVSQVQQTSRNVEPMPTATANIHEYTTWSRFNLFVGVLVLGIPSIILSLLTRKYKRKGDVKVSKMFSRVTLAWNIFINFIALIGGIFLITFFNDPF